MAQQAGPMWRRKEEVEKLLQKGIIWHLCACVYTHASQQEQ